VEPGTSGKQAGDLGGCLDHLLAIVQDQQQLTGPQIGDDRLLERPVASLAEADSMGNGGQDESGVPYRGEIDEERAVFEDIGDLSRDVKREMGLADPARTNEGHEPHAIAEQ
jgi:hypothetical protein